VNYEPPSIVIHDPSKERTLVGETKLIFNDINLSIYCRC